MSAGREGPGQLNSGQRRFTHVAPALDVNLSLLVGVVVRAPKVVHGVLELTLSGQVVTPGGVALPWYHKVQMGQDALPCAGEVWRVTGRLEQVKFRSDRGARSIVRLQADSAVRVLEHEAKVQFEQDPEGGRFFLAGGENRVRLSGNLTRAAESTVVPSGDRMTRLNLAAQGADGRKDYFLLKAWREQSGPVSALGKGARVGVNGVLLSERFEQKGTVVRNQVVVEVTASNTSGKRAG